MPVLAATGDPLTPLLVVHASDADPAAALAMPRGEEIALRTVVVAAGAVAIAGPGRPGEGDDLDIHQAPPIAT
jgi:hypothetical protein